MNNKSVENENEDVVLKAMEEYRLNSSERVKQRDLEQLEKECHSDISCDEYLGEIFGDKFDKK